MKCMTENTMSISSNQGALYSDYSVTLMFLVAMTKSLGSNNGKYLLFDMDIQKIGTGK